MKPRVTFRLIAPVTVGSALLGVSLLSQNATVDQHEVTVSPAKPRLLASATTPSASKAPAETLPAQDLKLDQLESSIRSAYAHRETSAKPIIPDKLAPVSRTQPPPTAPEDIQTRILADIAAPDTDPIYAAIPAQRAAETHSPAAQEPLETRAAVLPEPAKPVSAVAAPSSPQTAPQVASEEPNWREIPLFSAETLEAALAPLESSSSLPPVSSVDASSAPALEQVPQVQEVQPPAQTLTPAPATAMPVSETPTELARSLAFDDEEDSELSDQNQQPQSRFASASDPLELAAPAPTPEMAPAAISAEDTKTEIALLPVPATIPDETAAPKISDEAALPTVTETATLAPQQLRSFDLSPGEQTFPMPKGGPGFTYDDELILQLKVRGVEATDTIVAYGTRDAVYLPLGELAMILDLAIRVSDDGHYASGWFLSENRTVTINLREGELTVNGKTIQLEDGVAQAFEGDVFIRTEALASILPLDLKPDLRSQSVLLTTREPFPFEERMRREADRARLALQGSRGSQQESWPRAETPWLPLSVPVADLDSRIVSDSQRGTRGEVDVRLAGDFAWTTAQAFISATTQDRLVSSLIEMGRRDIDGELLGPLNATEFVFGDVATVAMPVGLRGSSGRGGFVSNLPFESFSVFDQVDLRGILPDGYEVELYRNGVLLGSTAVTNNGQYEFLQVPVDYGLNVFRIVFYGPQGQRREEVRRISVGDGRLSPGKLQYSFGVIQNGENVLGVQGPDFRPGERFGDWQAVGEVAYGLNSSLTALASAAFYEQDGENKWIAAAGVRTGLSGLAVRADAAMSDGGGYAAGLGLGGLALGGGFSLTHFEYGGGFVDQLRSFTSEALRRATELDFNTTLGLASGVLGTALPLNLRARHSEFLDGRRQITASLRASARLPGLIASNSLEVGLISNPGRENFSQLAGDFNLATFNQSRTQFRVSLGYQFLPQVELTQVAGDVDYAIDDQTVVSASAGYSLTNDELTVGASAIREFDRFALALDGQYSPQRGTYSAALRVNLSFGRDPLRRNIFVSTPGWATSGAVALRAFQDLDGDLVYGPGDRALQDVDFAVFNNVASTNEDGFALLGELGNGNPVTVQADPSSLPDITMAPVQRGIELVPRPGRVHALDFPFVELSEIEGTVSFIREDSVRGVSGLRLRLRNQADSQDFWVRTERGGYYFFEQILPGNYDVILDPEQAKRLGICLDPHEPIIVPPTGSVLSQDFSVRLCENAED